MHTYRVTGLIGYCLYGQWSEIQVSEEVQAPNAGEARDHVLARHEPIARRQDPQATVVWKETPQARRLVALEWQT